MILIEPFTGLTTRCDRAPGPSLRANPGASLWAILLPIAGILIDRAHNIETLTDEVAVTYYYSFCILLLITMNLKSTLYHNRFVGLFALNVEHSLSFQKIQSDVMTISIPQIWS